MSPAHVAIYTAAFIGLLMAATAVEQYVIGPRRKASELRHLDRIERRIGVAIRQRRLAAADHDLQEYGYWNGRLERLMGVSYERYGAGDTTRTG